jgi:hypothetical protein
MPGDRPNGSRNKRTFENMKVAAEAAPYLHPKLVASHNTGEKEQTFEDAAPGDDATAVLFCFSIPRGPLRPRQPAEGRQRWRHDVAPHEEQQ